MKTSKSQPATIALCLAVILAGGFGLQAATQTQNLPLNYGWNAVWLEVEPVNGAGVVLAVDEAFVAAGFVIDIVARPLDPVGTAEFIDNPATSFNQPGWLVWYANPPSGDKDRGPSLTLRPRCGCTKRLRNPSPESASSFASNRVILDNPGLTGSSPPTAR